MQLYSVRNQIARGNLLSERIDVSSEIEDFFRIRSSLARWRATKGRGVDERIRKLFVKRMGLILEKRENDAIGSAVRARSEANKHGMLHSSRTDLGVKGAYEETYDDICGDAWSELHHIAITVGVKPNGGLGR